MAERPSPVGLGLFAAACLAGAEVGRLFFVTNGGWTFPAIWPPSGLLLAALVHADRRRWGAWLLAACGAILTSGVVLHGQPLAAAIGVCAATCVEACIGGWVLQRVVETPFTMDRVRDVWAFSATALAATVVGAAIGAGAVYASGAPSPWVAWRMWWIGDLLGVLLAAPVLFAWRAERAVIAAFARSWRMLELAAVLAGAMALMQIVCGDVLPPLLRVPAYVLPFLLWAAFRFGPSGAAAAMLVVSLVGLWNTSLGRGPFTSVAISTGAAVMRAQGSAAVTSVSLMLLAGIVAERKRAASERTVLVGELQRALAEIKTLQGMIPICAWCHKIRDDAGFWQRTETYLSAHTQATVSHGICPDCANQLEASHETTDVTV